MTKNVRISILHQFFEQQALALPHQAAIKNDDETFTYDELDKKANQFARYLQHIGIRKGDRVGILLDRSAKVYLTMLAILKAGATYVPIHPDFPYDRINFIISDAGINLLISTTNFIELYAQFSCNILLLDQTQSAINEQILDPIPDIGLTEDDLCYIIYTSGTTGKPKGIAITHKAVCHYIVAAQEVYGINQADRVYQGFSIAFDASIEEIWLTFSVGATLIPGSEYTLKGGINIEFLNQHRITVLSCVPTFLAMLEPRITTLRILILGGEVCHAALLQPWYRRGLKIFNTYGPTEATVVATYCECNSKRPVTIGKPFPNYETFILDEELKPVREGEVGELCLAGPSLARNYINHPELDKVKFVYHPETNKRLYRTGDLVKMIKGEIQYIGRSDSQVKLRGYRIELADIENALFNLPTIQNAAVVLKELATGDQSLVAYIILKKDMEFNHDECHMLLAEKIPFYMIPTLYQIVDSFPLLPSGKIDKKHLPALNVTWTKRSNKYVSPRNEIEKIIIEALEDLFKHKPISIKDDFFYDLNGHSLLAAIFVSTLRKKPEFSFVSIRDLYENPTAEKLASKVIQNNKISNTVAIKKNLPEREKRWSYYFCSIGQAFGCYLQIAFTAWQFLAVFLLITWAEKSTPILSAHFFLKLVAFLLLLHPVLLIIAVAAKWLLLGRVKPGRYQLWGWFYFRWWLSRQIAHCLVPAKILAGSPLFIWYCRLMGAHIGAHCCLRSHLIDSFDVLSIGEQTSVGVEASLLGYHMDDNWLTIGSINIGDRCYIGNNSILSPNTIMHDDAKLEDQSMLSIGEIIPEGKYYEGSPAKFSHSERKEIQTSSAEVPGIIKEIYFGLLHYVFSLMVLLRFTLAITPGIVLIDYFYDRAGLTIALCFTPISALLFILIFCFATVTIKKWIIGAFQSGHYAVYSLTYVRKWLFERLIATSIETVGSIYSTLYVIPWLKLLGAKIGKRVEISTPNYIAPDLLNIKKESFIADYAQIGVPCVYQGIITFYPTEIGVRSFIGNSAVIPAGTILGDGSLMGCLSIPPKRCQATKKNASWGGSPAMFLPKREMQQAFSNHETYRPSVTLYLQRLMMDFFRLILPTTFVYITIMLAVCFAEKMQAAQLSMITLFFILPLFFTAIFFSFSGFIIALKWLLMGRYKPDVKPAWSMFVFKNELVNGLYDFYLDEILNYLVGTPFLPWILRLLGADIGKQVLLDTTCFTEFDLVKIGNHVAINKDATIQTHLFEDRIFKMSRVTIHDNCNIGAKSVVLYDTVQEENSSLASLSLLMKGEILPAHSYWEGIPAELKLSMS